MGTGTIDNESTNNNTVTGNTVKNYVENKLENLEIKYKNNDSQGENKVKLIDCLNFLKDDNSNILVETSSNGVIKHKLNTNLSNIDSLRKNNTKISLTDGIITLSNDSDTVLLKI